MRQSAVIYDWRQFLWGRKTAEQAANRLRRLLASDRTILRSDATKRMNAELSEVLSRYFSVADVTFTVEPAGFSMRYTLEATLDFQDSDAPEN